VRVIDKGCRVRTVCGAFRPVRASLPVRRRPIRAQTIVARTMTTTIRSGFVAESTLGVDDAQIHAGT
jgi:hypothetical protein